ncbi:unnamed protein product [Cylicocyclus nassatus]|uniref:DUF4440 domain-containing protein n=1 Tax=Cylicocyclus nassatus TaxID=53992 RepID=A0AA36MAA4_CYLNA|nr:unnamed protein product [Cylicocyclus nassatus]
MSTFKKAQSILRPIFDQYWKDFSKANIDKVIAYYHPDALVVEAGKGGVFGKEAIKQEKTDFNENTGKAPMKVTNENYQMTPDYIIYDAEYEIRSSKSGLQKGRFSQIWKKNKDDYLILREEYSADSPADDNIAKSSEGITADTPPDDKVTKSYDRTTA